MRKLLLAALAALAALLTAGSAGAIINGEPDGNRHPYVVALGFIDPATGGPGPFCTGTLISPRVVVTAGHCTYKSPAAFVWFDEQLDFRKPPAAIGMPVTHPDFQEDRQVPNTGDLGVVLLNRPIAMSTYGQLPAEGSLDSFSRQKGKQELGVTLVGYGLQSLVGPAFARMTGKAQIRNINSNNVREYGLQTSNSRGNGTGGSGTCEGDSGGPILLGDSNVIIGVNSWAQNTNCVGNDFSYRTDTASARSFLGQFVSLP